MDPIKCNSLNQIVKDSPTEDSPIFNYNELMLSCVEVQVSVKLMGICSVGLNFNWAKNLLGTSSSILVIFMVNVICVAEWIPFVLRGWKLTGKKM